MRIVGSTKILALHSNGNSVLSPVMKQSLIKDPYRRLEI